MNTVAQPPRPDYAAANRRLALKLGVAATLMFSFGYGMAPLYYRFCNFVGLDHARPELSNVNAEAIRLEFDANVADGLPLTVEPLDPVVAAKPGRLVKSKFRVVNLGDQPMIIRAVPSFAPQRSASYLTKLECFCFTAMHMKPREDRVVTVVLAVSAKLPDEIGAATLSYTFHRISSDGQAAPAPTS